MPSSILQFLSMAVFSFGAPAFVVLSVLYWRNKHRSTALFRIFTAVCAAAFLSNLASVLLLIDNPAFEITQAVLVSLLPPLMLHLTVDRSEKALARRVFWRGATSVLYFAAVMSAVARVLNWSDSLEKAEALIIGTSAGLALAHMLPSQLRNTERRWYVFLFAGMFVVAITVALSDNSLVELAPDYLLLLFFSVHLYYHERLAFFDVFLRFGAFAAMGVIVFASGLMALPTSRTALEGDWNRAWLAALILTPVWLLAPFLYRRLGLWVDQRAFGRRYSPEGAETAFVLNLQGATTDEELRTSAESILAEIFNCRAEIDFEGNAALSPEDLGVSIIPSGSVLLKSRDSHAPFLSDDHRLLKTLSSTLGLMLQNVRLRRQREDLRKMASRAELRALRAQINPHFLFNALNAIASSIVTKPEAAEETLTQLAEVFRYTLSRSYKEWVSLAEEVDFLRSYLAVEQARFGNRLQIEIHGHGATFSGSIPTMILQPLVENAIRHGTSQVAGVGKVAIEINGFDELLRITVRDNGPGFPAGFQCGAGTGLGLRSVFERLRGYYGDRGVLRCENDPAGSCVTIEIPQGVQRQCAS